MQTSTRIRLELTIMLRVFGLEDVIADCAVSLLGHPYRLPYFMQI